MGKTAEDMGGVIGPHSNELTPCSEGWGRYSEFRSLRVLKALIASKSELRWQCRKP